MEINKYVGIYRGMEHKHHCEDFALVLQKNDWHIAAVADGCSSGITSHFAATLACKLLRKCVTNLSFEGDISPEAGGLQLLHLWIAELKQAAQLLSLERDELLATLLLLIYHPKHDSALIWALGDGIVAIDGKIEEIDHQNLPDYPAYHLHDSPQDMLSYLTKQTFLVKKPRQIAISTDGAASFQSSGQLSASEGQRFALTYLLNDTPFEKNNQMIARQINVLFNQYGLAPQDDVGIVKFLFKRD